MSPYLVVFSMVSTIVSIMVLTRLAPRIGLVDIPNSRKSHVGHVPVIGGLSIVISLLASWLVFDFAWPFNQTISLLGLVLFLFGLMDDRADLSPKFRFILQILVAVLTTFVGDLHLYYFGNIFAAGDLFLGFWGELLTMLAIVTAINAFNMIDGIDGLLAMLLLVVFCSMSWIAPGYSELYLVCITLLSVFLLFNLGLNASGKGRHKIFMGDAGSMLFGYMVVCLLIDKSQYPQAEIRPVTVLWIIAIPLMDLVAIVIRRSRKKQPIMKADRDHLHHIFIRMGLSDRWALCWIVSIAVLFAIIGLVAEQQDVPEVIMFGAFMAIFGLYLYFILHAWRFVRLFNLLKQRQ